MFSQSRFFYATVTKFSIHHSLIQKYILLNLLKSFGRSVKKQNINLSVMSQQFFQLLYIMFHQFGIVHWIMLFVLQSSDGNILFVKYLLQSYFQCFQIFHVGTCAVHQFIFARSYFHCLSQRIVALKCLRIKRNVHIGALSCFNVDAFECYNPLKIGRAHV